MNCPYCTKEDTTVIESRVLPDGDGVRRRRSCLRCNKRFTTNERVVNIDLKIIKKSGKVEQYNREKLTKGVAKACYKRGISAVAVEDLIDRIEVKLMNRKGLMVKSCDVGKLVMSSLKKLDSLAYLRFASVYLDFDNFDDFKKFLLKTLDVNN